MKNRYEQLFDEFLSIIEFGLVKYESEHSDDGIWGVVDFQGANLADIESDRFQTAEDIFNRMGHYIDDYFIRDIDELLDEINVEITWNEDYKEYIKNGKPLLPQYSFDFEILEMICYHAKEIDLEKCKYSVN